MPSSQDFELTKYIKLIRVWSYLLVYLELNGGVNNELSVAKAELCLHLRVDIVRIIHVKLD